MLINIKNPFISVNLSDYQSQPTANKIAFLVSKLDKMTQSQRSETIATLYDALNYSERLLLFMEGFDKYRNILNQYIASRQDSLEIAA